MEDFIVKLNVFIDSISQPIWQERLLRGLFNTIQIAVLGLIIGICIGTVIAVIEVGPKYSILIKILDKICNVYVALFRGTPMVVQLLIAYYILLPALNVGIAVFGMNSGAYISEIMRSGINSVDSGQMEAGRAVGLSYATTMIKIVVPQAIKNIVPTLGNEFITLIKETSVLSFITVFDLYTMCKMLGTANYEITVPYLFMAIVYIVLVLLITLLVRLVEKLMAKSDRTVAVKGGKA
ncbi:MAG: amino acid ABC transporter permease [Clostridia bacterium]|nr:amino acid ABC transporter permease [Clostridia bacterium]